MAKLKWKVENAQRRNEGDGETQMESGKRTTTEAKGDVLFGIDKQVAPLGFDPYRSATTLNNQKRRKPLKLIDWTGTRTPISLLLRFSSSNSVEEAPWPHDVKFSF